MAYEFRLHGVLNYISVAWCLDLHFCSSDCVVTRNICCPRLHQPRNLLLFVQMLEELYFGHLPLEFGNALTNLGLCYRRLDDLDQAEAVYKR